ncbi:hypothetical protein B0H13DRAFT_1946975, partial [Mycena leptocephala]
MAPRDHEDGYIWIKGRIDDVIDVSGHQLSTAKIESALIMHKGVAETAGAYAFVTLKPEFTYDPNEAALAKEFVLQVRKVIGPFTAPKKIYIVPDQRRILRKIVAGEGDQLATSAPPQSPVSWTSSSRRSWR